MKKLFSPLAAALLILVPIVSHASLKSRTFRGSEDPKFDPSTAPDYARCTVQEVIHETTYMASCGLKGHAPDASVLTFDVVCSGSTPSDAPAPSFMHATMRCISGGVPSFQSGDYWDDTNDMNSPSEPTQLALPPIKAAAFATGISQTEGRALHELQWRVEQLQSQRGARKAMSPAHKEALHLAAVALRLADATFARGQLFQAQAPLHAAYLLAQAADPSAPQDDRIPNALLQKVEAMRKQGLTLARIEPLVCPTDLGCVPSTAAALPTALQSAARASSFDRPWAQAIIRR